MARANIIEYINRKQVLEEAYFMLENGNSTVTAVEVASKLFPELVRYVAQVMEEDNQLRIGDSQEDIPHLGVNFVFD